MFEYLPIFLIEFRLFEKFKMKIESITTLSTCYDRRVVRFTSFWNVYRIFVLYIYITIVFIQ